MGALESNTTQIYGVHLRESADDGSDFSNAAADYRVLFLGEDGELHLKDSAGTVTDMPGAGGASGLAVATTQGTGSADYTTTSTTFVDVDGTNLTITPTNAQSGDILRIEAFCEIFSSGVIQTAVTLGIAGTDVGDTLGLGFAGTTTSKPYTLIYYYTMPSGTQPAIKLRWKTASGTGTMYNRSAVIRPRMSVTNMSRGGTL